MPIEPATTCIPAGQPAWARTTTAADYGGDPNKTNFRDQGVTNARTDIGAEQFCRITADLAAAVRTAPFCTLTIECDDTTPAPPKVIVVNQMTGMQIVPYRGNHPPLGFPSVARNGNGDVTITWDAAYADEYGVSAPVNFQHADVGIKGITPLAHACQITANTVRVKLFTVPAGTAAVSPTFTLSVY